MKKSPSIFYIYEGYSVNEVQGIMNVEKEVVNSRVFQTKGILTYPCQICWVSNP
jgi:hypothetical protein